MSSLTELKERGVTAAASSLGDVTDRAVSRNEPQGKHAPFPVLVPPLLTTSSKLRAKLTKGQEVKDEGFKLYVLFHSFNWTAHKIFLHFFRTMPIRIPYSLVKMTCIFDSLRQDVEHKIESSELTSGVKEFSLSLLGNDFVSVQGRVQR
jgi:hypothetical protein